ncbi:hypothetical protein IC757_11110 [Wenzhouxiangella sp. AB-CW3]|uniref:hypothetical protein n=1 Tax=Wenzhouxiangella sp. AB-CW3 TaxID=2771012 RepID=UPI00168B1961|nr:hypothetical protein [Wenzhouxiangella sp. AB-CW3]QOC21589.1 hypothetical protein IC757_11110 [Wenzhouxiangella sp. AB-CW3]
MGESVDRSLSCPLQADLELKTDPGIRAQWEPAEMVQPAEALSSTSGQLVVIGESSSQTVSRLSEVVTVESGELANLVRTTHAPLYVAGAGYDDLNLATRLGRWRNSDASVRYVRGGLPALLLGSDQDYSDHALMDRLSVPADRVIGILHESSWLIVSLDEINLPNALRDKVSATESGADSLASAFDVLAHAGVLLVDQDGSDASRKALALSRLHGHPIFFAQGGAQALQYRYGRFVTMNRQPEARTGTGCP